MKSTCISDPLIGCGEISASREDGCHKREVSPKASRFYALVPLIFVLKFMDKIAYYVGCSELLASLEIF
jgi:hypothetical protein